MTEEESAILLEEGNTPKPRMPLYAQVLQSCSNIIFALGVTAFILIALAFLASLVRLSLFGGFRYQLPWSDILDYIIGVLGGTALATIPAAALVALPTLICALVVNARVKDDEINHMCLNAIKNSCAVFLVLLFAAMIIPKVVTW